MEKDLKVVITGDSSQGENSIRSFGSSLTSLSALSVALGVALEQLAIKILGLGENAIAGSVKSAVDFQSAMTLVQTQAGASAQEVQNMSNAILAMSGTDVSATPIQLANALFYVESAGYRGSQALDILKLSAQGAAVGHADLNSVANALTTVLTSEIGGINNASDAMGQMNAIIGAGKMKMDDLTAALSTGVLPIAKLAGISFEQLGATIATLTNNGVPAIDGAARLRMSISMMDDPTSKATKSLKELGLQNTSLAEDMQKGGIVQALQDLHDHMKNLSSVAKEQLFGNMFGVREGATMMTLVENVDQLKDRLNQVKDTAGNFGDAVRTNAETAAEQMKMFQANIQVLGITIGNALLPILNSLLSVVNNNMAGIKNLVTNGINVLTQAFQYIYNFFQTNLMPSLNMLFDMYKQHQDEINTLAQTLGVILVAAIIVVVTAITALIAIIAEVVLGIAILVSAIEKGAVSGFNTFKQIITVVQNAFISFKNTVIDTANSIISSIRGMVNSVVDDINRLISSFNSIGSKVGVHVGSIPHFAAGGVAPGGLALVGENGPELVNLPGGAKVFNNQQSRQMVGGSTTININNPSVRSDQDIKDIIYQVMRALGRQDELMRLGAF